MSTSDFFLCLARAFAIPQAAESLELLRDALPEDLAELATDCGYEIDEPLSDFRAAIAAIPDANRLLVIYSRLFLVPGDRHPSLNTGAYLDGTVAGGSVTAMETCYRRCGLEKNAAVQDLPDHLSVQLEFLARLFAAESQACITGAVSPPIAAGEFLASFVGRWIGSFRADLEEAGRRFKLADNPYRHLARILERAVRAEVALQPGEAPPAPTIDPEIGRLRSQLTGKPITEEDLAIIRARLAADGLPSDHVAIPVDDRDRIMGLSTMIPPAAASHRMASPG
ncbi:molecular chaperone TorD family protein [Thiocapsa sp.]|uniref:TorD/DmsD family molecular chaperone n=1 Tax=Thiocapsa sp. TaxID=2024551 RepID=UPI0025E83833|nr:molecular chaperone TorD family protein [Thiocapsa sp.]